MSADQFIAARVSSETKDRLKSLAAKRQLSESALLKDLLELTLGGPAVPAPDGAESVARVARGARLYVRLRPGDQLLLAERAAARRMAAATYVSVLVRAHLRHLAPLPHDELRALNRVVGELVPSAATSTRLYGRPIRPLRLPDLTAATFFDLVSHGRRGPGRRDRLSTALIQQIARTVARTPEVMVKVLPAGANPTTGSGCWTVKPLQT